MTRKEDLPNFRLCAMSSLGDDTQEEVASLHNWLLQDADIAGDVLIEELESSRKSGEMAGSFDTILAVTGQAISFANLLIAYLTWRSTRPTQRRDQISVQISIEGNTINIQGMNETQIHSLIERLQQGRFNEDS